MIEGGIVSETSMLKGDIELNYEIKKDIKYENKFALESEQNKIKEIVEKKDFNFANRKIRIFA